MKEALTERRRAWCIDHGGGKVGEINVLVSDGAADDCGQR
jgi:hypothetical protein